MRRCFQARENRARIGRPGISGTWRPTAVNDELPERPKARLTIMPLDDLGVAELRAYIGELQGEIGRAEAMIGRKQDHLGAAAKIFGSRSGGA